MDMLAIALVLAFFTLTGQGRRLQTANDEEPVSAEQVTRGASDELASLAELLVASNPAIAFNPFGSGAHEKYRTKCRRTFLTQQVKGVNTPSHSGAVVPTQSGKYVPQRYWQLLKGAVSTKHGHTARAGDVQMVTKKKGVTKGAVKMVLTQPIEGKGKAGDAIVVKQHYAEQVIERRGWGYRPTAEQLLELEQKEAKDAEDAAILTAAKEDLAEAMEKKYSEGIPISKKAGRDGVLFGKVTTMDLEEVLNKDFPTAQIDRKSDIVAPAMNRVGEYEIQVKLQKGVSVNLKVDIQPE